MTIALLAGTRPNFIKAAPLWQALRRYADWNLQLIHTGQHRDAGLSAVFFSDLRLPEPDVTLKVPAGSPVRQIASIMRGLEPVFQKTKPDWVLVIGDVTSTLAGAMVAKQMGLKVAHVEAGLRSGDRDMPEELNRIAVDHLADLLFASEESGVDNLRREGIPEARIHFTGNVLIDALCAVLPQAEKLQPEKIATQALQAASKGTFSKKYALCTFHRPSNVDTVANLNRTIELLEILSRKIPVIFPCHPRTIKQCKQFGLYAQMIRQPNLWVLPPLSYPEIIALARNANFVVTDSGGLQEETTFLNIPCLTYRKNTERPSTLVYGTNMLLPHFDLEKTAQHLQNLSARENAIPPLWDGHASERIAAILNQTLEKKIT